MHAALLLAACSAEGPRPPVHPPSAPYSTTSAEIPYPAADPALVWTERTGGLRVADAEVGAGEEVDGSEQLVELEIDGWLPDGHLWWSTRRRPLGTRFVVGSAPMRALDLGVIGMREGGRRLVEAPAALAFRSDGAASRVPPDSPVLLSLSLLSASRCPELPPQIPRDALQEIGLGIKIADLVLGEGAEITPGAIVTFDRFEWLLDGSLIGSSCHQNAPARARYGSGSLRWESAMAGMREGGSRLVHIPAEQLAAEDRKGEGASVIPEGEDLLLRLDLHTVRPTE